MKNFLVFYKTFRDDSLISQDSLFLKASSLVNAIYEAEYIFTHFSDDFNYSVIEARECV